MKSPRSRNLGTTGLYRTVAAYIYRFNFVTCKSLLQLITDVNFINDTVFIKLFKPGNNVIYEQENIAFGIPVIKDTSATYENYLRIWQPEYYKKKSK